MSDTITATTIIRIYSFICDECGKGLKYKQELDPEDDLFVTVEPCSTCITNAVDEYKDEMSDD